MSPVELGFAHLVEYAFKTRRDFVLCPHPPFHRTGKHSRDAHHRLHITLPGRNFTLSALHQNTTMRHKERPLSDGTEASRTCGELPHSARSSNGSRERSDGQADASNR